jgi:hypothetical protein
MPLDPITDDDNDEDGEESQTGSLELRYGQSQCVWSLTVVIVHKGRYCSLPVLLFLC